MRGVNTASAAYHGLIAEVATDLLADKDRSAGEVFTDHMGSGYGFFTGVGGYAIRLAVGAAYSKDELKDSIDENYAAHPTMPCARWSRPFPSGSMKSTPAQTRLG